jgi:hypothetical protein
VSALVLATGYLLVFPDVIVGGNLAAYALPLTLLAALSLRVVVYVFAKVPPFSERVLIFGGGRFAGEVARQIETRPDLALRAVGCRVSRLQRALKRVMSLAALIVAAPALAAIAVAIKLESRRPAFFIQDRVACGASGSVW